LGLLGNVVRKKILKGKKKAIETAPLWGRGSDRERQVARIAAQKNELKEEINCKAE